MLSRRFRTGRKTAGVTLVEVVAACSLMGVIFIATAFLMSGTAKQVRALYSDCRTLNRAHLVMQFIHYRLSMAMVGAVSISEDRHTIKFYSPMNGPNVGEPGTTSTAYSSHHGSVTFEFCWP